jgi:hypothetical protein
MLDKEARPILYQHQIVKEKIDGNPIHHLLQIMQEIHKLTFLKEEDFFHKKQVQL